MIKRKKKPDKNYTANDGHISSAAVLMKQKKNLVSITKFQYRKEQNKLHRVIKL